VYRFGSMAEWEALQVGDQVDLKQFEAEDDAYHIYWHDKELMLVALDKNNRIISKQLYTHLDDRDAAFRVNNGTYIESVLSSTISSTDYLYYFEGNEMKTINDPNVLEWLNDADSVNKIQLPGPLETSYSVGFIVTVNGEQQIHHLNESRENNLRSLPGLGRDLLNNKSEGAKIMTKHILQGMYAGSPYYPKGFEYDFILKQYMADFSEESKLTMERIGEIVVAHDKSDTTLKHVQHIQNVKRQMAIAEDRVRMLREASLHEEVMTFLEDLREQVELIREERLRTEYNAILDKLEKNI